MFSIWKTARFPAAPLRFGHDREPRLHHAAPAAGARGAADPVVASARGAPGPDPQAVSGCRPSAGASGRREPDRQDAMVAAAVAHACHCRRDRRLRGPRAEPPDRAGGRWTVADRDGCVLGLGAGLGRPDRAGQRPAGRGWPVGPARGHRRIDRPAGRASGIPVCKCLGGASAIGIPGALRAGLCGGGGLDREPRRGGGRLLGLRRTGP